MVFHLTYYFLVVFTFLMTILQKIIHIVDLNIIDINKTLSWFALDMNLVLIVLYMLLTWSTCVFIAASRHSGDAGCAGQAGPGHGQAERRGVGTKVRLRRRLLPRHVILVAKNEASALVPLR